LTAVKILLEIDCFDPKTTGISNLMGMIRQEFSSWVSEGYKILIEKSLVFC